MNVGQYAVIWNTTFRRPAVLSKATMITSIGKRIKCTDYRGNYRLLHPSEVLAVFDDKDRADALAQELYALGEEHNIATRNALAFTEQKIKKTAKEREEQP